MHRNYEPKKPNDLETSGTVIHWDPRHDFFQRLLGMGVDGSNSRMIMEMARVKAGDRVLDVGCGTGELTLTAQIHAGEAGCAYGIDPSAEGIELARKKAKRSGLKAVFEVGLVEKIAFPEANFDLVINRLVIHHLPDDLKRQGLKEILRVLKPGGKLFIADFRPPVNPILAHATLAVVGHRMMQTDVRHLPAMLSEAGFVEVDFGRTGSPFLGYVSGIKPGG